jgi:hypothetical protein
VNRVLTYLVVCCVLVGYLFIATAGHISLLSNVLNSTGTSQSISVEGKSRPIDTKPVWTQRKHIPSSIKIEVPAAGLVVVTQPPLEDRSVPLVTIVPRVDSQLEEFHPYLPRDPTLS